MDMNDHLWLLAKMIHNNPFYHNGYEFQRFTWYIMSEINPSTLYLRKEELLLKKFKRITTLDEAKATISKDNYMNDLEYDLLTDAINNKSCDIFKYIISFASEDILSPLYISRIMEIGNVDKLDVIFKYIKQLKGDIFFESYLCNLNYDSYYRHDERYIIHILELAIRSQNWKIIKYVNSHVPILDENIITGLYNRHDEKYVNYIIATNQNYYYDRADLLNEISIYAAGKMRIVLYKQKMRSLRKIVKVGKVKEFLLQRVVWRPNSSYIKRIYQNY